MCFSELLYSNTLLIFKQHHTGESAVVLNVITGAMRSSRQCISSHGMPVGQSNACSKPITNYFNVFTPIPCLRVFKEAEICLLHEEE